MAKSKIARQTNSVKRVRNSQNIVSLNLTIPYKSSVLNKPMQFDVSHLLHLGCKKESEKIDNRAVFIRRFCENTNKYVSNGNSARTVVASYEILVPILSFVMR